MYPLVEDAPNWLHVGNKKTIFPKGPIFPKTGVIRIRPR